MTITRDELISVMTEILDERRSMDADEHAEHHAWIQERIEAERARKAMYIECAKAAAQWSVTGILAGVLYYVKQYFNV